MYTASLSQNQQRILALRSPAPADDNPPEQPELSVLIRIHLRRKLFSLHQ
jgi:hypothetical protein